MSTSLDDIENLYVSEHHRLERVAARRVGAAHAADVVHDVFMALWDRARGDQPFSPRYLTGATRYAAIGHYRAERRREALLRRMTEEQYAAPVPSPDQIVAARQDLDRLNAVLAALPARTRQIFLLNRAHQCTYDEIAAALEISYSTVEREIARALLACRVGIE
ncbi:sigma-70 family RNA polymerase sigma factor [Ancylobacter sp. Lp-2]|uniref:RNA polymerase sigma factor n=1 Tax=Ancylobacter sp. Lp-2 TaxID=2881339 RepID=UPI001E4B9632|nr:sigma-70 family RNA polymerase sigma factor [Ancylobacter sp. Lp-2]MCB4768575.1 sigma-70 family RNA polymerase sigma factor [Ancylobacter sp. Lp-2]